MIRRSLPVIGAALVAAGAVATIGLADDSSTAPSTPAAATTVAAPASAASPAAVIADKVAGTTSVPVAEASLDSSVLELLATAQNVDVQRTWKLPIPGESRPAWLFAGTDRVALVVPRVLKDPTGRTFPNAVSTFGASVDEIANHGLAGSQSGGGQASRKIVLVPPGAPAPRIVSSGTTKTVRGVDHVGQLYIGQPADGEELLSPSLESGQRLKSTP